MINLSTLIEKQRKQRKYKKTRLEVVLVVGFEKQRKQRKYKKTRLEVVLVVGFPQAGIILYVYKEPNVGGTY